MSASARLNRDPSSDTAERITPWTPLSASREHPLVIPEVSEELIGYLNHTFPDSLRLVDKLGSVLAAQGARTVVEHLTTLFKEQQDTPHVLRRQQIDASLPDGPGSPAPGGG